jgi:pimeloyl-ACP methyl ester carboxylesterase
MSPITTNSIIFITGAFISHHVWDEWIARFKAKGYDCIAPPWPYKDGPANVLRNQRPDDSKISKIGLKELLDHYTAIVEQEPQKPIVIGHSLGGLIVQLLVNKDAVAAGVALHSMPPQGSHSVDLHSFRSILKPLSSITSPGKAQLMGIKEWKNNVANGMTPREQQDSYEKYAIPAAKASYNDLFTKTAKIDFDKQHPPLLFISGTDDKITPPAINHANYLKYNRFHSVTGHKKFENRNHLAPVMNGWEEVADYIADWLEVVKQ